VQRSVPWPEGGTNTMCNSSWWWVRWKLTTRMNPSTNPPLF
jgi:hypothetical protein